MQPVDLIIFGNAICDGISENPYQGFIEINGSKISKVCRGLPKRDDYGTDTLWIDAGNRLVSPAEAMQCKKDFGSLEAGKLADVIVLSRNILAIPLEEVKDVSVDYTIKDGKIVYQKY